MPESEKYLRSKKPIRQIISSTLESHEQILWSGQPIPGYAFWSGFPGNSWFIRLLYIAMGLVVIQPFSLAGFYFAKVGALSFMLFASVTSIIASLLMTLFGLGLGLGSYLYLMWPRLKSYRNAKFIHYVLTNRRAMILLINEGEIKDERIKFLQHISNPWIKMLNSKGIGGLIYDSGGAAHSGSDGPGYHTHYDVGFEGIADVELVLDIMEKAIVGLKR